jgi:hypothetical protein
VLYHVLVAVRPLGVTLEDVKDVLPAALEDDAQVVPWACRAHAYWNVTSGAKHTGTKHPQLSECGRAQGPEGRVPFVPLPVWDRFNHSLVWGGYMGVDPRRGS